MRDVAVFTDVTSGGHYLPRFARYYSGLFGGDDVIVQAYPGADVDPSLGVRVEPVDEGYEDASRAARVSARVAELLREYRTVIRVDADEFLVVDPNSGLDLAGHVAAFGGTYTTSHGFDVIPSPGEGPLGEGPVLEQRRLAFGATALNKTNVVRRPVRWNPGFHYCDVRPSLGGIYLFHLKRADIDAHRSWNGHMLAGHAPTDHLKGYYADNEDTIGNYTRSRWDLPTVGGPESLRRTGFDARFMSQIEERPDGLHDGPYDFEGVNVTIPDRFVGLF